MYIFVYKRSFLWYFRMCTILSGLILTFNLVNQAKDAFLKIFSLNCLRSKELPFPPPTLTHNLTHLLDSSRLARRVEAEALGPLLGP